jgi:hypothetical protein
MRLVDAAEAIRAEGAHVVEVAEVTGSRVIEGDAWKRRGHEYTRAPVCVTWHHTANDWTDVDGVDLGILSFELHKYASTPGNNVNIHPDGTVYLLAAGATATNGAGTQLSFSRGMGGKNSTTFTMEIHNPGNGGKPYPQAQIDAAFAVSNAINRLCGNLATDLCTHYEYAMTRKTDPAPATAVQGAWVPRPCTHAGTWHHDDIRAEAVRRWEQPQGDWFDMATEAELEAVVQKVVSANINFLLTNPEARAQLGSTLWTHPLTNKVSGAPENAGDLLAWAHADAYGARLAAEADNPPE